MGPKERKNRERGERRELILNAAAEIMTTEGLDNLSIRKIATKIEYSPAIIYHYFKDKDDIISHLMKKGYLKILKGLSSSENSSDTPELKLAKLMQNYINTALQMPDEYKTVQLSTSPEVLDFTSSLFKGASARKPALGILSQCLKELYQGKNVDDDLIELTAQIISTATFGLIIRLIIEKDRISDAQRKNLIEHHIRLIVNGMAFWNRE